MSVSNKDLCNTIRNLLDSVLEMLPELTPVGNQNTAAGDFSFARLATRDMTYSGL
jgi:hypothetical protein